MLNLSKDIVITFNGEIYNYKDIKKELIELGYHEWQSNSDTEVLLRAYECWGIDCVHKLRGMFAFALWDQRQEILWLVRDRLGIKPLYFTLDNNRITFASECKALLQTSQNPRLNEEAFFHYLSFMTTPAPQTLFDHIKKIPCATWLKVNRNGQITEHKYWNVWNEVKPLRYQSEEDIAKNVLDELKASVKLHKESDVKVGVFLSGGIDSSTNAALFSIDESKPISTYSIGYEGQYQTYQNELSYARTMAEAVKANHHERLLTVDHLIDFVPHMIYLQDEPIADPVCVPVYYVSDLARKEGAKVCQVGEGADELFFGYPTWAIKLKLQKYGNFPFTGLGKTALSWLLKLSKKDQGLPYEMLRRNIAKLPIFWGGAEAFTEAQKRSLLSLRLQKKFAELSSWQVIQPFWSQFQNEAWDRSILNWMSYIDLNIRLPELLLMRVDKMSMGVSLETRVPFLDHKFVELAMSIPAHLKFKNGVLKNILKKAVRGVIPDQLIDRKKQGFGVPIHEWFQDKLGQTIKNDMQRFCQQFDILNPSAVNLLIEQRCGTQLWYLFNFVQWWKRYIQDF
jgi:asparagine synthase (glutamine-hydrolysing)